MLQINYIRENQAEVKRRLQVKNFKEIDLLEKVLGLDDQRRKIQTELDATLNEANQLAKSVADYFKTGKHAEADGAKTKSIDLKNKSKTLQDSIQKVEEEIQHMLLVIPNLPHDSVPTGTTPADNAVVYEHGAMPQLPANAKPHWELATQYQLIDFELGVKIAGAGFPVYKGWGAKLQRALINYFLDEATALGYTEIQPPVLVNAASGFGTGQLPDKEGQMYHVALDNLYLIPTAEVPITNIYRDVVLKEDQFPIKNCGYSSCFRREAGSYGKDVRGLNRLHQFDKVEIVQIVHPAQSYAVLEEMKDYVANLLKQLELPFRVLKLCGGDMSFASALTYDMEVYSAAQQKWLEVSSVSNFESFQSNRLKLRYKSKEGKNHLAHTLNGSALALPRIVAALLENNQTEQGIRVPKVLIPYMGCDFITAPALATV